MFTIISRNYFLLVDIVEQKVKYRIWVDEMKEERKEKGEKKKKKKEEKGGGKILDS